MACQNPPLQITPGAHLGQTPSQAKQEKRKPPPGLPELVRKPLSLPRAAAEKTYSVTVRDTPAQSLLFALARDSGQEMDVHPDIEGSVTLNARKQTLPQLLTRIARQVDMRWEHENGVWTIMPDAPYLRSYHADYVNMSRDIALITAVNPNVNTAGNTSTGLADAGLGNSGVVRIEGIAKNRFWETLEKNIKDILRETDKILPEGSSETTVEIQGQRAGNLAAQKRRSTNRSHEREESQAMRADAQAPLPLVHSREQESAVVRRATFREAASVIINSETGVILVRATTRQHERVHEFLEQVMRSAKRQVLIEATIAEVQLAEGYQQGIDWQSISASSGFTLTQAAPGILGSAGLGVAETLAGVRQVPSGVLPSQASASGNAVGSLFVMTYRSGGFLAAVKLLESFGTVRVLSSPKLAVLNNQTALLNVGNQLVYFKVNANTTTSSNGLSQTTVDTTPQTASVGLLLAVTPQIGRDGEVVLNVRPSISRVTRFRQDPNPQIPNGIQNLVPEIERRELTSLLRVQDGETAVLGGLMQDSVDRRDDAVPGLSSLPLLGSLFSYKNHSVGKSELVIFLRPTVLAAPASTTQQPPGKAAASAGKEAGHWFSLANQYAAEGDCSTALPAFHEALQRMTAHPDILHNIAVCEEMEQRAAHALQYYQRALFASLEQKPGFDSKRVRERVRTLQRLAILPAVE